MRTRTSAVLTLVATLLASHMSGFACLFDCEPPQRATAQAEPGQGGASAAEPGSCHRAAEEVPVTDVSLTAAPHDCGSHIAAAGARTTPRAFSVVPQIRTHPVILIDRESAVAGARMLQSCDPHDLAPPGTGPRSSAPLRI